MYNDIAAEYLLKVHQSYDVFRRGQVLRLLVHIAAHENHHVGA